MLSDRAAVTVTTSGTRVLLSSTPGDYASMVILTADAANTGTLFVGGSTVLASTGQGIPLLKGTPLVLPPLNPTYPAYNLNQMYVDSTASGDKVHIGIVNP